MTCVRPGCQRSAVTYSGWRWAHCGEHLSALMYGAFSDSPLTAPLLDGSRGRQPAAERPPVSASPGLR